MGGEMPLGSHVTAAQWHICHAKANPTCLQLLPKDAWVAIPAGHFLHLLRDLSQCLGIESLDAGDLPREQRDTQTTRCLLRILK